MVLTEKFLWPKFDCIKKIQKLWDIATIIICHFLFHLPSVVDVDVGATKVVIWFSVWIKNSCRSYLIKNLLNSSIVTKIVGMKNHDQRYS